MLIAIWIACANVTALVADARGRNFFAWMLIGAVTGPFSLVAILLTNRPDTFPPQSKPLRTLL